MENQDIYNIYSLYKEGWKVPSNYSHPFFQRGGDQSHRYGDSGNDSGVVDMWITYDDGREDSDIDRHVSVEIQNGEIVSVVDYETGEDVPLSAITRKDYKTAIARLNEGI